MGRSDELRLRRRWATASDNVISTDRFRAIGAGAGESNEHTWSGIIRLPTAYEKAV